MCEGNVHAAGTNPSLLGEDRLRARSHPRISSKISEYSEGELEGREAVEGRRGGEVDDTIASLDGSLHCPPD